MARVAKDFTQKWVRSPPAAPSLETQSPRGCHWNHNCSASERLCFLFGVEWLCFLTQVFFPALATKYWLKNCGVSLEERFSCLSGGKQPEQLWFPRNGYGSKHNWERGLPFAGGTTVLYFFPKCFCNCNRRRWWWAQCVLCGAGSGHASHMHGRLVCEVGIGGRAQAICRCESVMSSRVNGLRAVDRHLGVCLGKSAQ